MINLVLLPGLDGTGVAFTDFTAALGPEVNSIVVSYPPNVPLSYAELEAVARSFIPTDEPFFLLAESFSGPIAISIAATAPSGLMGLILSCSFARYPRRALALVRPILYGIPISAVPKASLGFFLLGRYSTPTRQALLERMIGLVSPAVLRFRIRAALAVDVSISLGQIKVPVLYLRASEDRVIPPSASGLIAARTSCNRLKEFRAPHFLLQVLPDEAAEVVSGFMANPFATPPKE
jgi:pimeloyl-ACP methyl ester carboxylesterase